MSKLVELRERMVAVTGQMRDLSLKDQRSADEEASIDALIREFNDLGPAIERETALDAAGKRNAEYTQSSGTRASAMQPKPGAETRAKLETRSVGRIVAEDVDIDGYLKRGGKGRTEPVEVGSFYPELRQRHIIEHSADMSPEELRTLIYSGTLSADMVSPQILPTIYRANEPLNDVRSVLINGQTSSDALIYFIESSFTNAAAEVAEAVDTTTGTKPESAIALTQATAPVQTIAHWIPITRQTLQDAAQMQTYVEQRLIDGLRRRENAQLLNGNGTAPNLRGLLNTSGIQSLTTAGEFTTSPVADAASNNENFNRIRRAKTKVRVGAGATPTFVILNPTNLEKFETYTDTTKNYLMGDPMSGAAVQRLWGMRVVENENIAVNTALVGDGSMAAVWDRMDAQIFVADQHSDFFIKNIFVLLAEERLALTVFRPAAFASVQLV
jgi:HK97 family phage major capsid protein